MKKPITFVVTLGIFFLFLIQMAGTLVESIYILDLMNTTLDEKVLGLIFFFTPAILYLYKDKRPALTAWVLFGILFLARGVTPYLNTIGRMLSSGIGIGAILTLVPFLFSARLKDKNRSSPGIWMSAGLALAGGLSVFLRTINFGLDYSLFPEGGWAGWILGVILGMLLTQLDWGRPGRTRRGARPVTLPIIGIFLAITLVWFAFSAPSVISRWTEGNYRGIVIAVSTFSLAWVGFSLTKTNWIENVSRAGLLFLNLLFAVSLTLTLLAHRVPFPLTPESPAVVVGAPTWFQIIPLAITLILFPVIFLDVRFFADRIQAVHPAPRDLVPGILLGSLLMVVLVFIHIFTNVWGYVEPVSLWFRNLFWLPFAVITGLLSLLSLLKRLPVVGKPTDNEVGISWLAWVLLGMLYIGTVGSAFYTTRTLKFDPRPGGVLVMTYNIQAANNDSGERSVEEQLALIQEVGPDILALQESDTTRVSLNNNDFVRYFAGKLGYYSYFGPTTTTGTYGTAILSRYPLINPRTAFTYSDQDEIGTAEVEVEISGEVFTIFNVHPAGSDTAKMAFAEYIVERRTDSRFISLGDYNLRDDDEAYRLIDEVLVNAWISNYPGEIGPDAKDVSGVKWIDHIFISPDLKAENPVYILPPESATDHPVHWAEITWE